MDANERGVGGRAPSGEISSALADLKRTGGAVLLVGDGPEWIGRRVRKRLFGDGSARSRYRIHVSTGSAGSYRPRDVGDEEWRVIEYATRRRGAVRSASGGHSGRGNRVCTSLPELGIAISATIEEFDERAGGLEPNQLRLGFDSVIPLLEADKASAFRFVHLLVKRVETVGGLLHVPLSRPYDSEVVRLFAPLFDVVVEVRLNEGVAQQRWHFVKRNLVSDWLSSSR